MTDRLDRLTDDRAPEVSSLLPCVVLFQCVQRYRVDVGEYEEWWWLVLYGRTGLD